MEENEQTQRLDIASIQDAITIDPSVLGADIQPAVPTQQKLTVPEQYSPSPVPDEAEKLRQMTGTDSSSSAAGWLIDAIDQDIGNVITPELDMKAQQELGALSRAEFEQLGGLFDGRPVPQEILDKVPNFVRLNDLSEGNTVLQKIKPIVRFPADLVQGAAMGAVKAANNIPVAFVDFLNFVDDNTIDVIPNDMVRQMDANSEQLNKMLDAAVPDGVLFKSLPSIASVVAQGAVGSYVYSFVPGGPDAPIQLLRSALNSATTFGIKGTNIFNVFEEYTDNPSLNALWASLAVHDDDSILMAVIKNTTGSIVSDKIMEAMMKPIKKARNILRPHVDKVAKEIVDGADDALIQQRLQKAIADMDPKEAKKLKDAVKRFVDLADEAKTFSDTVNNREILDIEDMSDDIVHNADNVVDDVVRKTAKQTTPPPSSEPPVSTPKGKASKINTDELLQRAMALKNNKSLDADTFTTTHDVINPKITKDFMSKDGAKRLLQLGNDVPDANSLGRDTAQYVVEHGDDVRRAAQSALSDLTGTMFELEEVANISDKLSVSVVKARQLLAEHTVVLDGLLEKLNRPDITEAAKKAIVDGPVTNALENLAYITDIWDRISTGVARGLKAHQYDMLDSVLTEPVKNGTYERLLQKLPDMGMNEKVALLRMMKDARTARASAKLLAAFSSSNWKKGMSVAGEYWYNSILSGVKTGMRNHLGNAIQQGIIMPADNFVRGLVFRDKQAWNDGVKAFWAMKESLGEAWSMFTSAIRHGTNIMGVDTGVIKPQLKAISSAYWNLDPDGMLGKAVDALGTAVNLPTRYLVASDEFWQQLAARSNIRTYLWTEAERIFESGAVQGIAKKDFILDYVSKHFGDYFTDVADSYKNVIAKGGALNLKAGEAAMRALDAAKRATFAQDLKKGSIAWHLSKAAQDNPALRIITPFIKIPTNILGEGLAHSPLAVVMPSYWQAIKAGGQAAQIAKSKLIVGGVFSAVAAAYSFAGNITGAAPRNAKVRDSLYSAGWRPYSFKVGDTYISYEGWEPVSTVFGLIADFVQTFKDSSGGMDFNTDAGENSDAAMAALGVLHAVTNNLTTKSYMQGLAETLDLLTSDNPDKLLKTVHNFGLSFVPNGLTSIRKFIDPSVREARTFLDGLMNKLPLFNESLPMKYDWLTGEPIHYMGDRYSGVSPFVFSTKENDEVQKAMAHVVGLIPAPGRRVNDNPLNAQQYSDFCRLNGTVKIGGKTLTQAIAREYKKLEGQPIDEIKAHLVKLAGEYRKAAKAKLISQYPELKSKPKEKKMQSSIFGTPTQTTSMTYTERVMSQFQ